LGALIVFCGLSAAVAASPDTTTPNSAVFPGARNHWVTQANIYQTICSSPAHDSPGGWTKTVRPPLEYTNSIKHRLLEAAHLPPSAIHDYELDHLIPLELGGAPRDPRNLWLQSWTGPWNAHAKDDLERRLNFMVCRGEITLQEAQEAIAGNWIYAYRQFMAGRAEESHRAHSRGW